MIRFINEDGNKELKNRVFPLSNGIKKHLIQTLKDYDGDKTLDGYKRLKNILSMTNGIKYGEMKRLKNFFDNYTGTPNSTEFILNGGEPMKLWVNNTLNTATTAIRDFKQAKKEAGFSNAFIKPHEKNRQTKKKNKPTQVKFKTNNLNKKVGDNSVMQYENMIKENDSKQRKVICVTENQAKYIKKILTEAQNDNFSLEELSSINSFKSRYDYCVKNIGQPCGRGTSRAVFQLTDEKVLKLAYNQKGIAQNSAEDEPYISVSPKIFDRDMDYKWLISEYVLPAKKQDFKECLGLTFEEFCSFLSASHKNHCNGRYYRQIMPREQYVELLDSNEDLYDFDEYIGNYQPPLGDLMRIINYGMVLRSNTPTIVLLDTGLTEEIYDNFYRR